MCARQALSCASVGAFRGDVMRYTAPLAALLVLAGCQTAPPPTPQNSGHLQHSFTDVTRGTVSGEPGFTHIFEFTEVFRETRGIGVRLTRSRICYVVENECFNNTYDITISANSTYRVEMTILSSDPAREAFTEVYEGRDNNGNPVILTTHFAASDYRF